MNMKKWKSLLLILCLFFMPLVVSAKEATNKLYMDVTILENGDIKIKELAELSGSYNGRLRTIHYQNSQAPIFTGSESDFDGSDIYNGTGITIDKVADVKIADGISFESMNQLHRIFSRVYETPQVAYQVYEETPTVNGVDLKIYNPDRMNTAFYLEYTIQNAVVVHNDVAELAWNLLGDFYQENIGTFEARVHLPGEDQDYRVWLKGPLNGEVERKDNQTAIATYDFIGAYNAVTIRLMFDKNLVPNAVKMSHVDGRELILASEKKAADLANQERERIQNQNKIIIVLTAVWGIVFLSSLGYFIYQLRKNRKAHFEQDYFRDFPATYGPEVLEYLLKKRIGEDSLSACILSLIEKKIITVEEDSSKKKKEYLFTWNEKEENVTEVEKQVLHLLFKEVGNGKTVSLEAFKNYGKSYHDAQGFIENYQTFISLSTAISKEENFFQNAPFCKIITIMMAMIGIPISFVLLGLEWVIIGLVLLVCLIGVLIYVASSKFYTEKGREDLAKWKALKHFLEDFSTFDEKELPEVTLWGKYLVYATVLGCAETLQKQMKIKIDTMSTNTSLGYDMIFWNRLYLYNTISYSVNQSVHTAVSSSRSSIAASSRSSSGGFGGGASFGGGSFGGGGGGGRF